MKKQILFSICVLCLLTGAAFLTTIWISCAVPVPAESSAMSPSFEPIVAVPERIPVDPGGGCTAVCLDNGDHCVFAANLDNSVESGLLFVNKRHVLKTTWDPSTSGEYARLTNSTYRQSVSTWEERQRHANLRDENSLWRFVVAADRDEAFEPSTSDAAVAYAFDTLEAVSGDNTVWSLVFDPVRLRVHFRTNRNPRIRYLDLAALDFSCRTPVRLLDVHADLSGDVSDSLVAYSHKASFAHSIVFFTQYEGYTMSPLLVDTLLWGLESFSCQDGGLPTQANLVRYRRVLPPAAAWAGLTILHRVGPFWVPLLVLSLACLVWRMRLELPAFWGKQLVWVLVTLVLGPLGLLAYVLARWRKHRAVMRRFL